MIVRQFSNDPHRMLCTEFAPIAGNGERLTLFFLARYLAEAKVGKSGYSRNLDSASSLVVAAEVYVVQQHDEKIRRTLLSGREK